MESKKLYYTMGEVSELFCVAPSLIRYWEKHFSVIKPVRNKKGNRLFTPADVENFKIIYHLVKERGMTLEGAQRTMKQNRKGYSRDAELLERMHHIRAMLLEVREELKEPGGGDENGEKEGVKIDGAKVEDARGDDWQDRDTQGQDLQDQDEQDQYSLDQDTQDQDIIDFKDHEELFRRTIYLEEMSVEEINDDESGDNESGEGDVDDDTEAKPENGDPIDHSTRNTKRTPDAQNKELFAFYEQSLF